MIEGNRRDRARPDSAWWWTSDTFIPWLIIPLNSNDECVSVFVNKLVFLWVTLTSWVVLVAAIGVVGGLGNPRMLQKIIRMYWYLYETYTCRCIYVDWWFTNTSSWRVERGGWSGSGSHYTSPFREEQITSNYILFIHRIWRDIAKSSDRC